MYLKEFDKKGPHDDDIMKIMIITNIFNNVFIITSVRMAQRAHMMMIVRSTGNIANNRNLAKPLKRRMNILS